MRCGRWTRPASSITGESPNHVPCRPHSRRRYCPQALHGNPGSAEKNRPALRWRAPRRLRDVALTRMSVRSGSGNAATASMVAARIRASISAGGCRRGPAAASNVPDVFFRSRFVPNVPFCHLNHSCSRRTSAKPCRNADLALASSDCTAITPSPNRSAISSTDSPSRYFHSSALAYLSGR